MTVLRARRGRYGAQGRRHRGDGKQATPEADRNTFKICSAASTTRFARPSRSPCSPAPATTAGSTTPRHWPRAHARARMDAGPL